MLEFLAKLFGWLIPSRDNRRADFESVTDGFRELANMTRKELSEAHKRLDKMDERIRESRDKLEACEEDRDNLRRLIRRTDILEERVRVVEEEVVDGGDGGNVDG